MIPLFLWDLGLSVLESKVYQDLYTGHTLQQSVSELLSSIRGLDEALEQWRLSTHLILFPANASERQGKHNGSNIEARLLSL